MRNLFSPIGSEPFGVKVRHVFTDWINYSLTSKLRYGKMRPHFKRGVKKKREVWNVTKRGDGAIISNALFGMFLVSSVNGRPWSESYFLFSVWGPKAGGRGNDPWKRGGSGQ